MLNKAGMTTRSYKNSFNVEYKHQNEKNKKGYVDFNRIDNIKILDNEEIYQVDSDCFESSKQIELENWKQNQVYNEIPYSGKQFLSNGYVS